jgi:hypothetical protein
MMAGLWHCEHPPRMRRSLGGKPLIGGVVAGLIAPQLQVEILSRCLDSPEQAAVVALFPGTNVDDLAGGRRELKSACRVSQHGLGRSLEAHRRPGYRTLTVRHRPRNQLLPRRRPYRWQVQTASGQYRQEDHGGPNARLIPEMPLHCQSLLRLRSSRAAFLCHFRFFPRVRKLALGMVMGGFEIASSPP